MNAILIQCLVPPSALMFPYVPQVSCRFYELLYKSGVCVCVCVYVCNIPLQGITVAIQLVNV